MPAPSPPSELPVVLLIDDDLVSREVTATLLIMSGYTVHTAEDGAASVNMLAEGACAPSVILMDTQMPGLSGLPLIAALRAHTRALVYAVSGSHPPPEVAAAADGFLPKPFDATALRKLLEGSPATAPRTHFEPGEPVLSMETLARLREMMSEAAVRQIYAALVADLASRIEALGIAFAHGDLAEVHRIGHTIKGGCGMAGAMQAARLGALLEILPSSGKDNYIDNSATLLRDLRAALRDLEGILEKGLPA